LPNFAVDKISRQLRYLRSLPDVEFLFALGDALRALETDPEIARHLLDLSKEADDLGKDLRADEVDNGNPDQVLEIAWDELGKVVRGRGREQLIRLNREFAELNEDREHAVVVPLDPNGGGEDAGRVGRMLSFIEELGGGEMVGRMRPGYENVRVHQQRAHLRLLRLTRTHPGVSLLRLRCVTEMDVDGHFREQADSCPRRSDDPPALGVSTIAGRRTWSGLLDELLSGRRELSDLTSAPELITVLRGAVERVGVELEGRIGTIRTRLALIDRYKARCEWHDRDRLLEIAESAERRREHALRDQLALYLFDNGLNPISEARLGDHARADVFHPDPVESFVLEAKQYGKGQGLESGLRAAFRQALDTVGALRGSGYEAQEGFIVLFRLGGPRSVLPADPIYADGIRWYLRLINVAPPEEDASQNQKTPEEYGVDRLREILIEVASEIGTEE
jgi:hypothetical protein